MSQGCAGDDVKVNFYFIASKELLLPLPPLIIPLPHLRLQPPPLKLPLPPAEKMMGRPGWEVVCGEGEAGQRLLHRPVGNVFMKIS